jgi:hypothetical protein
MKPMNPPNFRVQANQVVEVAPSERWQVYRRLQELGIPCRCRTNQPLSVQIDDVAAGIQLWSVVRHLTVPRRDLATWLEHCWRLPSVEEC